MIKEAATEFLLTLSVLFDGWKKMFSNNMKSKPSFGLERRLEVSAYSYFKDSTGFFEAALMEWKITVNRAIANAVIPATMNIHVWIRA